MEEDDEAAVQGGLRAGRRPLPILRPEEHRPWEIERPNGWTLSQARLELVSIVHQGPVSMVLAASAVGARDRSSEEAWLRQFWWDVLAQLQRGDLLMRARRIGEIQIQDISPDLLDDAEPDFDTNRITCCGMTFGAVRIFKSEPPMAPAAAGEAPQPLCILPPAAPEVRAREWMVQNVTPTQRWKRPDALAECRRAADVTDAIARDAWTNLPSDLKGTRGHRKP